MAGPVNQQRIPAGTCGGRNSSMSDQFQRKAENAAHATLMTEGNISRKLIAFAVPLFLGNLFQQLYNTADSLIVGNFLGSDALAAVSSSSPLIFLMVGFFNGIFMGAGVVIAHFYGAEDDSMVQKAVHTTILVGLCCGVLLTAVGLTFAPQMLILMGTPETVLPQSTSYFKIYFAGSLAFIMYNVFVGILQSVGDSRHPLQYLIISSFINIALDLLLVGYFRFGVGAAAFATILSQFISASLCAVHLLHAKDSYRFIPAKLRIDRSMLRRIASNGLPSGFQNSVIALANVVVQSNINAFGKSAVAGCGAYSKIEGFAFLPVTCFALSLSTFVSQNLGAQKFDRVKKGTRFGMTCSLCLAELVGLLIFTASPVIIAAFNSDPEVIAYGVSQARTVTLFYFLLAFSHCVAGIMRGAGRATVPMFVMLACWCLIRVTYITIITRLVPDIRVVFWAYPLTWTLSSIIFLLYYKKGSWMRAKTV